MFSKFKLTPSPNAYSTYFPLVEVYEAEIRRLRSENEFLKLQNNSLVVQLNEALVKLDKQRAPFNATQKGFWQLTRSGRNKKKRKIKSLVLESVRGFEELVPKEVSFSVLPWLCFKMIQLLRGTLGFALLQYRTVLKFSLQYFGYFLSRNAVLGGYSPTPACWMRFFNILDGIKIILLVLQCFLSLFQFPMKVSSHW